MRSPATAALLASALAVLPLAGVHAHHGWSSYETKAVTINAPIATVRYANPHGEIGLDHDGKRWTVVLAPVSRMQARGLPESALEVGKTVTVEAYPLKTGEPEMRAERITIDGKTIELR